MIKKENILNWIILILLIILFISYSLIIYLKKKNRNKNEEIYEHFEEKIENSDIYEDFYDSKYVDFYNYIYNEFKDIEYDFTIIKKKVLDNIKNKSAIHVLIEGCGVGKNSHYFKKNDIPITSVDISKNMLLKAQKNYPNIKFTLGDITNTKLFPFNHFSHILLDERTLYYHKPDIQQKIIYNNFQWLKDKGFLIVPIYDRDQLQVASQHYTVNYIDNKQNTHGHTFFNGITHDCYYIKDKKNKELYNFYDKIIIQKTEKKKIKMIPFYFMEKEKIYDMILSIGFELYYKEPIHGQVMGGYELAIFRKIKLQTTFEEIQKNEKKIKFKK